ncbi:ABC transporter permease/M1 family aminopeptidase [Oligoflexus tunisiensis]|uniref:ABC transporter permease/M1 family aminopeptidase n=1 Tax=Oligoflexus tunisiensis TaxID=708132 RepID=UPI000A62F9EC|nr:M1 family aminopeptidase [Oligoflexus tunisiensis]
MMQSLITNLKIELTLRKRLISTYVYFLLMATIAFLVVYFTAGGLKGISISLGNSPKTLLNGPYALHNAFFQISLLGMLIISPIFGQAVCKDYEAKIDQIVLATPTHRIGFYLGRFLGAIAFSTFIFSGIGLGYLLGTFLPMLKPSLLGNTQLSAYILPYLTTIIPNIIIFGSIFFAVAAFTKRMGAVYVMGILLYLGYIFSMSFSQKIEYLTLRGLVDPFGSTAGDILTEYWSPMEQDTRPITLTGILLYNRLLWLGFSLVMLVLGLFFTQKNLQRRLRDKAESTLESVPRFTWKAVPLQFDAASRLRLLGRQLLFESIASFKNIFFVSIALAGIIFILISAPHIGEMFGTVTYPVTYNILETTVGIFITFLIAIQIFYTGELLWRERQSRMSQIFDALPQPGWLPLISKFLALQLVILSLLALCGLTGMVIQVFKGYTNFELDQVVRTLFLISYPRFLILSCFFFFVHVLVNNKYLGHTLCVAFMLVQVVVLPTLDFSQVLYLPGKVPGSVTYSDMNGYGHFLPNLHAYQLYWGLGGLIALIAAYLLWPYGTDSALSLRQKLARQRLSRPLAGVLALILVAFASQGAYIYYNTNVLTPYLSDEETENLLAFYEKTYKAEWEKRDQLQYIATDLKADIYPEEQKLKTVMSSTLENKAAAPIDRILLHIPVDQDQFTLEFDRPAELVQHDKNLHLYIYAFQEPVAPGTKVHMTYRLDYQPRGFRERAEEISLVANGTFFNNGTFFPDIGYEPGRELSLDKDREKHGLAPKPRANPIDDVDALKFTYIGKSGNWIDFSATISTSADQIAMAPGYLQKEWTEGNRRYFEYKMDRKILNFYSIVSARYEVKKDRWNDVAIEVYYQKGHEYNVDTMIQASKAGLEYFSKAFGPYQHRQFRILEFPRYRTFAQSFPNTVPFAESIGFIAKIDPKSTEDFNYPFYVTAHELAHQWWAHQVIGGDVQGSPALTETMAQYSATMVMEKVFGKEHVERFLRHEGRSYLIKRTSEPKREWPLALNENQPYIYYNKGAQVMYALKEVVGEDALNAAIRRFADQVRFQEPPFTTAPALVNNLKTDLGAHTSLIDELFNKVILYDNRIQSHKVTENPDGSVTVDLEILGRKIDVDEKGAQKDIDFTLDMEVAARSADDKLLPGSHHVIKSGVNSIQLKFAQKPKSLALDPLSMWIDLNREDNKVSL